MAFQLRPYQQRAVDSALGHVKKSIESCLLELATGAGKSIIVAEIARGIRDMSGGKKVLCLAPSKELIEQNCEKYLSYGEPASLFCASTGKKKSVRHDVVFGSPQSVIGDIDKFNDRFAAVVIDECHGITPTLKKIIEEIKNKNPNLRVIGLTATPYRMGVGYIYEYNMDGTKVDDTETIEPYFKKLLCSVKTQELLDLGFLTPMRELELSMSYDTDNLVLKANGKFDEKTVRECFENDKAKTFAAVAESVEKTEKCNGVMFFASTIQHAEIINGLLGNESTIIHGKLNKKDRESRINKFKNRNLKYIVNVDVLTTGFDAPHVDAVVVMRATESASLYQQILGRGLRLNDEKEECLLLDYAGNTVRHELFDSLFEPKISVKSNGSLPKLIGACPACSTQGLYPVNFNLCGHVESEEDEEIENYHNYMSPLVCPDKIMGRDGYLYLDQACTERLEVEVSEGVRKPQPWTVKRSCGAIIGTLPSGEFKTCDYKWTYNECHVCEQDNDITARYCKNPKCKAELINYDEKLVIDLQKSKRNPYEPTDDDVISVRVDSHISAKGREGISITWKTDMRTFTTYHNPEVRFLKKQWDRISEALTGQVQDDPQKVVSYMSNIENKESIKTVCAIKKNKESSFFDIKRINGVTIAR